MGRKKIPLPVVDSPLPNAAIFAYSGTGAAWTGTDDVSLVCGKCGNVIARGVSEETFRARFVTAAQMLAKCVKCCAHNRLPVTVGN